MKPRHGGNKFKSQNRRFYRYPGEPDYVEKVNAFCDVPDCKGRQLYPPTLIVLIHVDGKNKKEFWLCERHDKYLDPSDVRRMASSVGIQDLQQWNMRKGVFDPTKKKIFWQ